MRVHHLNCATLCPPGRLVGTLVCHVLAVESAAGVVLVDCGLGTADLVAPRDRLGLFPWLVGARLDAAETARARLAALGIAPDDVRHVVLTHLDLDHAGGLADFPAATVHVGADEHAAATSGRDRKRYRAAQWAHGPRWQLAPSGGGERWHGFDGVRALVGLPPEILRVPLVGHSHGHQGVAVRADDGWWLHAGDAYFHAGEMHDPPAAPRTLRLFERLTEVDRAARLANQARLRALANDAAAGVRVFCAHDAAELARAQAGGAPARPAAGRVGTPPAAPRG